MPLRGVIFDMDGVLARTDEYHYESWRCLADETGMPFSRETFDGRMRGLARRDATGVFLEGAGAMTAERRLALPEPVALAARKDALFHEILSQRGLRPIPGAERLIDELRRRGVRLAVGSSSRNVDVVLRAVGLADAFDAVVDGAAAPGKPDPGIFLAAAARLGLPPAECVVIEDAADGVESARRAGIKVAAVGPADRLAAADLRVDRLDELTAERLAALIA